MTPEQALNVARQRVTRLALTDLNFREIVKDGPSSMSSWDALPKRVRQAQQKRLDTLLDNVTREKLHDACIRHG